MAKRTDGKTKLTPQVQQRLVKMAAEARELVYGAQGCPVWGTTFAEIEADAREVGHEFIRLVMEQTSDRQSHEIPAAALTTDTGEVAQRIGTEPRRVETESGEVCWPEPKAYLPQSRKVFFPSVPRVGVAGGRDAVAGGPAKVGASGDEADGVQVGSRQH